MAIEAETTHQALRKIIQAFDHVHSSGLIRVRSGIDLERSLHQIVFLLGERGQMRISDLADALALTSPTISRHVAKLIQAGVVERSDDSTDGRASIAQLSPHGQDVHADLKNTWNALFADALLGLDAEATPFAALLTAFADHLVEVSRQPVTVSSGLPVRTS